MDLISRFAFEIEIIGAIFSIVYLFFSIRKSIWLWPLGLLASFFYVLVYLMSKLYAEMGLQVYYIGVSIYGWYYWLCGKKDRESVSELPVTRLRLKQGIWYFLTFILFYLVLYLILKYFTDSTIPGWDSLVTALSLVATWMLAKKILENWLIWIIADAMCIVISVYKDLYFTAGLYIIYTVMAFVGYYQWKRSIKM